MSEYLLIDDIDDSDDENEDEAQLEGLRQELLSRCKESGIEAELKEYSEGETYILVRMPNGRDKRPQNTWTPNFRKASASVWL